VTPSRRLSPVLRALATLAVAGAVAVGAGCDPCAGLPSCRSAPRVEYEGRIIDFQTGRGVGGVTVVFRRTGGPPLDADSLVAETDGEGRFRLSVGAAGAGEVVGEVTIRPPAPRPRFSVGTVRLATSTVRGGGGVLETWAVQPYVSWVGSVVTRRGPGAAWASGLFYRTGGARLAGRDTIYVALDPNGYFYLEALALDTGTVVGSIDFLGSELSRVFRVDGVSIPVRVADRRPALDRVLTIGSSLDYAIEIRRRGSWVPISGAEVTFVRRGGLRLARDSVTSTSTREGLARIAPTPVSDSAGEVVGDVIVRGGGLRWPEVIRDVRLRTFDSDELRYRGLYGVGYAAQIAGDLFHRGDRLPLANADVRFVRTGGLETTTPTASARAGADGWFGLAFATDTAGEVVGDLVVQPAEGGTAETYRGVRLRAVADDSVRYVGRRGVGEQFGYAGILVHRATGAPAAGWTVSFRRTSGIELSADTLTSTVLDWGGFDLHPPTRQEGSVEGTLTARSPDGARSVALGTVRLSTWRSDSVQLAGRWAVGPSLLYVGELLRQDTGAPIVGARTEFRRTGGIATVENVVGEPSNAQGRFRMAPTPLATGEVVGDLHVFPPAPMRDTVFRDVRLQTFESDETRLYNVWRLAPPR
jgi:hypothetical protein